MPEVDNFYLDANGILHKSTHGDAGEIFGGAEGDQFIRMCNYLDSLVQLVRPRRLLYIAIDGVAPRAKMNQQRQRRYRVARDRAQQKAKDEAIAAEKAEKAAKEAAEEAEKKAKAAAQPALAAEAPAADEAEKPEEEEKPDEEMPAADAPGTTEPTTASTRTASHPAPSSWRR